mgnify:CR=1 FL=1
MHFRLKELISETAKETGLTFEQVKQMLDSEFLCTKEIMKEGEHDKVETFKNINIIKLGKIYFKPGIIESMKKNKLKKKQNND